VDLPEAARISYQQYKRFSWQDQGGSVKKKGEPFDQVKYQNDYIRERYDRISLAFPKGEKAAIKEAARKEGVSMSEYILAAVAEKMGRKI